MRSSFHRPLSGMIFAALLTTTLASAQQSNRTLQEIDASSAAALPGSINPRIAAGYDIGRLDPAAPLNDGVSASDTTTPITPVRASDRSNS